MKLPRIQIILALMLTGGLGALAQSGNTVPGPTDYASFSRFITERNIFDPNRVPHYTSARPRVQSRSHSASAPAFTLVGTMAYEKGLFAFFSGNSDELKQALPVAGQIAGYTVADISYGRVILETTNATTNAMASGMTNAIAKVELKVGDVMREENGKWQLAGAGEIVEDNSPAPSRSAETTSSAPAANPSASAPNDILKRLMEKREQENK
jgi:hypothetical protein